MAFGMGPMEVLLLLVFGGGGQTAEVVSFLPAEPYFKARNIQATIDNLAEIAGKDPVDGKTQIAQLLALRTLAERSAEVKNAGNSKDIIARIQKIARGELAKDAQGFSREYAQHVLAALGIEKTTARAAVPDLRASTLNWFPADVTLAGALDFMSDQAAAGQGKELREFWAKARFIQAREWDNIFNVVDQIGNVRIDRVSFGYSEDALTKLDRFFIRVTGRADHQKIIDALKKAGPADRMTVTTQKENGVPISLFGEPNGPAMMAMIGDTDLILVPGRKKAKDPNVKEPPDDRLAQMLAVRAGKQPSMLKGKLTANLEKINNKACGLLVGELPEGMRREMVREFGAMPKTLRAEILRDQTGLEVRAEGSFANADEAKTFTQSVFRLRKQGIESMDMIPKEIPIPQATVTAIKKTLESIQVQADGNSARGGLFVPMEAMRSLPTWFFLGASAEAVPPAPPKQNK